LGSWERLVVECDRDAANESECERAVDGFAFVEFEYTFFVPRPEHVKVGLNYIGCLERVNYVDC